MRLTLGHDARVYVQTDLEVHLFANLAREDSDSHSYVVMSSSAAIEFFNMLENSIAALEEHAQFKKI